MIPPNGSLVKYDTPILISSIKDTRGKSGKPAKRPAAPKQTTPTEDILNSILPPRYAVYCNLPLYLCCLAILSYIAMLNSSLDLLLCCIHSEWTQDGQLWVQYVSSTPATASDLLALQVCVV